MLKVFYSNQTERLLDTLINNIQAYRTESQLRRTSTVVVLAAGKGERLNGVSVGGQPKPAIIVSGISLAEHSIRRAKCPVFVVKDFGRSLINEKDR